METRQRISLETKEGKAFLRKIPKQNQALPYDQGWRLRASDATGWLIRFERTVKGAIGEPDEDVIVETDAKIGQPRERDIGPAVKSFEDAQPVCMPAPRRVYMNGETTHAARLLADGWRLSVEASAGSTSSSAHGLAFYTVAAHKHDVSCYPIYLGGETVLINGRPVIRSVVDID